MYLRVMTRRVPPSAYLEPVRSSASRRTQVNAFGTPRARVWQMPVGGTSAGMRAAKLQNSVARQLRDAISMSQWGSLAEFARQHDEFTYDRLRGTLSGDLWMRLEDVAEISYLLGLRPRLLVEPEVNSAEA